MKRGIAEMGNAGLGGGIRAAAWDYGDGSRGGGDEWELGFFCI